MLNGGQTHWATEIASWCKTPGQRRGSRIRTAHHEYSPAHRALRKSPAQDDDGTLVPASALEADAGIA